MQAGFGRGLPRSRWSLFSVANALGSSSLNFASIRPKEFPDGPRIQEQSNHWPHGTVYALCLADEPSDSPYWHIHCWSKEHA